jgi:hypothetical protein
VKCEAMNDKLVRVLLLMLVLALAFGVMKYVMYCNASRPLSVRYEMTNLVASLAFHRAVYGGFPTGNNAQIMGALGANNPIGPRRMARTNVALDIWQTAYRFSFASNSVITVSSAGANCSFGDNDDLVVCVSINDTNFPFMKVPASLTNSPPQK